jgi:hypothetical protein
MKFSVFKGDEGYENYLAHRPIVVYINGEMLNNVVRLDTAEGWAEFNVKDADGLFLIEDGEIVTDIAEGLVEIHGDGIELEPVVIEPEPLPEPPEEEPEEDA